MGLSYKPTYCSFIGRECPRLKQHHHHHDCHSSGLRDEIAMAYLASASRTDLRQMDADLEAFAKMAYRYADAFLEARKKECIPPVVPPPGP